MDDMFFIEAQGVKKLASSYYVENNNENLANLSKYVNWEYYYPTKEECLYFIKLAAKYERLLSLKKDDIDSFNELGVSLKKMKDIIKNGNVVINKYCGTNEQNFVFTNEECEYFKAIQNFMYHGINNINRTSYETIVVRMIDILEEALIEDPRLYNRVFIALLFKQEVYDFVVENPNNAVNDLLEINNCFKMNFQGEHEKTINILVDIYSKYDFKAGKIHNIVLDELINKYDCDGKSRQFYVDGMELLKLLKSNFSMDYSLVSLQFFKIIETEIKRKILKKSLKNVNMDKLMDDFKEYKNLLPIANKYKNCHLFNKENFDFIELGNIRYIFIQARELTKMAKNGEKIRTKHKDFIAFLQNLHDLLKLESNYDFYIDILHPKVLKVFRNPPAHTGFLNYDRLLQIEELLKIVLTNNSFIKMWDEPEEADEESETILCTRTPDFIKDIISS